MSISGSPTASSFPPYAAAPASPVSSAWLLLIAVVVVGVVCVVATFGHLSSTAVGVPQHQAQEAGTAR